EAVRVGQALGYALEDIGNLPPEKLARAAEGDNAAYAEIDALVASGSAIRGRNELQRPSMAQDMAKGRRTEIDFINGLVVEKGREIGMPTPVNARLVDVVKQVERGEIPARLANLVN
ncbi:MAG TPA: ketopantoate reductase C-terminal domain-containing protein, partial [Candidatus Sulfotelmatobacter sp.]|nr:ketopantoate reductase C-terminal domain-containing protein [Candidatus Sulfotelmatobacter sp.]